MISTPSFQEDHISQIPAIQLLVNLGYEYLTPEEALELRGGKTSNVLLEPILRSQLSTINEISYRGNTYDYNESNIASAIRAIKELPLQEGLITANERIYNKLILGESLEQSIDGDKKSYTMQYIDWHNWEHNVFHVTEEYSVLRSTSSSKSYRPDIVLFVNGIPLVIIECKRPDHKENMEQAISQHLRNQQPDGIMPLYAYSQLLLSLATNVARYGSTATEPKFWAKWKEKLTYKDEGQALDQLISEIKNTPLPNEVKDRLFGTRYKYVRAYFDQVEQQKILVTEQDEYLYHLCRPERLLSLIYKYLIYDAGIKKIARYQQYFAIEKVIERVAKVSGGKRRGGVIWHTQGSGKSLTMAMLAQALAMHDQIRNPKIVLVTDRVDLDDQIYKTFKKCKIPVLQAETGAKLVDLLSNKSDAVITTVINKFEAAVNRGGKTFDSHDIFVLIDEGHRTQYGTFSVKMNKIFPNACFIAFTGTPLSKKNRDTTSRFGGMIDTYTVDEAVADGAVVPLLYEGRHVLQEVNENAINSYFDRVLEGASEEYKSDMKKKFSKADQLNKAEQKIYTICLDISKHYKEQWQGTGFKGQLVCSNKLTAVRYKECLDMIGEVTTALVMSPPDTREGEESAYGETHDKVKLHWKKLMEEHTYAKRYEDNIISRYKYQEEPEIIIVVDKLLTGFDAPKNTVLYITRSLKEHTLLQAIARVNRVSPGKDYGYIIDYYGVMQELDEALKHYSTYQDFNTEDLQNTVTNVLNEIEKLPQAYSVLQDTFKTISNKYDEPDYEEYLSDEAIRVEFYDRLSIYSRLLKLALSSIEWNKTAKESDVKRYKEALGFYAKLRIAVKNRYSDTVDYKAYEKQIQKLIDQHVVSHEVQPITELVNIFETERFEEEIEKIVGSAAQADMMASRTSKHINERMDADPAFYKRFSDLIRETIADYRSRRISETEYLKRIKEIKDNVINKSDNSIPVALRAKPIAQAYYGINKELFAKQMSDSKALNELSIESGIEIDEIFSQHLIEDGTLRVDWTNKSDLINKISIEIGDYILDHIRDKYELDLSYQEINELTEKYISIAKRNYL